MTLKCKLIPSAGGYTVPLPQAATPGSAGLDLRACIDAPTTVPAGGTVMIPAGVAAEIPEGYVGLMFGRSGLGVMHRVTLANCVGVIDSDYRGELRAALVNGGAEDYTVLPGDRIAQLVLLPCAAVTPIEADELGETGRGAAGFGSTGR